MAASVACSFFFDAEPAGEHGVPALDACTLCSKPLARDSDIFMYRGDTPFCSEDCRDEQMQLDAVYARQAAGRMQRYASGAAARRGHQETGRSPSRADRRQSAKLRAWLWNSFVCSISKI